MYIHAFWLMMVRRKPTEKLPIVSKLSRDVFCIGYLSCPYDQETEKSNLKKGFCSFEWYSLSQWGRQRGKEWLVGCENLYFGFLILL